MQLIVYDKKRKKMVTELFLFGEKIMGGFAHVTEQKRMVLTKTISFVDLIIPTLKAVMWA